jgi:hypothetical protein
VHLLEQIALAVSVGFVPADQAAHGFPVLGLSLNVKLIFDRWDSIVASKSLFGEGQTALSTTRPFPGISILQMAKE